jgi:hypothetical protein
MITAAQTLCVALLLGPPSGERPPVQSPAVSPVQPQPGEPAIAPAHVDHVAEQPEPLPPEQPQPDPATVEPAPTEPPPDENGALPSWQSDPLPSDRGDPADIPPVDEWGTPIEPPPPKPGPPKGGGLFGGAGAMLGVMVTRQWITALVCEDVYCGWRGNFDRVLSLGVMGLAAGGGWLHGRRRAYLQHEAGTPAKPPTGRRAAGWTLFALGFGGLIADTVLSNLCYQQAKGPYTQLSGFSYTCSPVASVVVVDISTLIGAVGIGMGMSAESQIRNRAKFDLAVSPYAGQGQAGLSLSGRF